MIADFLNSLSRKTKIIVVSVSATTAVLLLLLYVVLGPFISLYVIKTGVENKDSKVLARYVDFDSLRGSAKQQIQQSIYKSWGVDLAKQNDSQNMLANLALRIADQLVEKAVDSAVSPVGMSMLLSGEKVDYQPSKQQVENEITTQKSMEAKKPQLAFRDWLKRGDYVYHSHQRFSLFIYDKNNKQTELVLTRHGMRWRLSDVIFEKVVISNKEATPP